MMVELKESDNVMRSQSENFYHKKLRQIRFQYHYRRLHEFIFCRRKIKKNRNFPIPCSCYVHTRQRQTDENEGNRGKRFPFDDDFPSLFLSLASNQINKLCLLKM